MSPFPMLFLPLFLLQTTFAAFPFHHICSNPTNTKNTPAYTSNVDKLITHLTLNTPKTGFNTSTFGLKPDQLFGLGLCRADIPPSDCTTCITQASAELRKRCPLANTKSAIIWYDLCQLKYSDVEFFGKIDMVNKFYNCRTRSVSDLALFDKQRKDLLAEIMEEAPTDALKLYEDEDREIGGDKKVYGLGQCTRDLSGKDCFKCLDGIIKALPPVCDGKEGAMYFSGSCGFRYEVYNFIREDVEDH